MTSVENLAMNCNFPRLGALALPNSGSLERLLRGSADNPKIRLYDHQ